MPATIEIPEAIIIAVSTHRFYRSPAPRNRRRQSQLLTGLRIARSHRVAVVPK